MSVYFVTGATGAVGSAVVGRLLADPDATVIALVRGDSAEAAARRLHGALDGIETVTARPQRERRIRVVTGDVHEPQFALARADLDTVVGTCTHVVHCAGIVRMNLPLDAARQAAVASARNAIELARRLAVAGRLAKVELVSTVGVAGRTHRVLSEDWIGAQHAFHNSYEQAKAEAETEMQTAVADGLPVTVHRPSMVVGDSRTGYTPHFQVFYFLVDFLSGSRTAGLFPRLGDARLDIVPSDFVAEAIVCSSATQATTGRILHLCAGPQRAVPLVRLQHIVRDRLAARGARLPRARFVSRPAFRRMARTLELVVDARTRAALSTLPVFLDYLDTDQAFDNARTREWLAQARIAVPDAEAYLPRVLDYYFDFAARARRPVRRDGAGRSETAT